MPARRVPLRPTARLVLLVVAALAVSGCALVLRASVSDDGQAGDAASSSPVLDRDGSVVAFASDATNLAPGDGNAATDVYVRDLQAGATELISAVPGGGTAAGTSSSPDLAADGTVVAFVSDAADLVLGDANGRADVFVRDRTTATTERVSVDAAGSELPWTSGAASCWAPDESACEPTERGVAISDDGTIVAFVSRDPDTGRPAVLVRDRTAGTTSAVLVASETAGAADSRHLDVALSGDGSVLAVTEQVRPPGGGDPQSGLRVVDVGTGASSWVSAPGAGGCCSPALDQDGRHVAFTSDTAHVAEDDPPGGPDVDVFVHDRQTSTYERVSVGGDGSELDEGASGPSITDDGNVVGWSSTAAATAIDPAGNAQLYLHDRAADETWLASSASVGFGPADAPVRGVVSGDGIVVALETAATNQAAGAAQPDAQVLVRMAETPVVTSPPTDVQAGSTSVPLTIEGRGFGPGTVALTTHTEVTVDGVAPISDTQLEVTISSLAGAELGPVPLLLTVLGPHGLSASTACTCAQLTYDYEPPAPSVTQPDLVLVNTDDQRGDSMDQLPQMAARADWAVFENSFVHEPQCCPSRAATFTGQYAHHNGVTVLRDGEDLDESSTIATMLHDGGYQTAHFGKYLNGYPFGPVPYTPPGWDRFSAYYGRQPPGFPLLDEAEGLPYYNFYNVEDGAFVGHPRSSSSYSTDVYARQARDFIRNADPTKPLFIYLAPITPHFPLIPADRHEGACNGVPFPLPPSFNAYDTVEEPPWMSRTKPKSAPYENDKRRTTCELLQAADEAVVSLIDELERAGRLADANLVYTSDNGFSFGEHRLSGKGQLYDESVRVPLWATGSDVTPGSYDRLTSNIDLAPTLLDWADLAPPPGFFDGTSFADDLDGSNTVPNPDAVLLFGCRTSPESDECGGTSDWFGHAWGLRTATHKYVVYEDGYEQLFEVASDPYELTNLAPDPANAALLDDLRAQLLAMGGGIVPISGRVTDAVTGEPVAGIHVLPYVDGAYLLANTVITDADGWYRFYGVPPGQYRLRFDDPLGRYVREYYDDADRLSAATFLTLTDGGEVQADVSLAPG